MWFLSSFVNGNAFSFQNKLYIFCAFSKIHLKIHKTFSYNLFCDINYVYFLCDQMPI